MKNLYSLGDNGNWTLIGQVNDIKMNVIRDEKAYIAIPYSHENEEIMERRYEFVSRYTARMTEGFIPFSPITHTHTMQKLGNLPTSWDYWKRQNIPFLDWADKMFVLMAHGVHESTGVEAERDYFDGPQYEVDPLETSAIEVIGVSGKKRSGKDLLGDHLADEHGFEKYALADPIKEACQTIFLFDEYQTDGSEKEKVDPYWGMTPRKAMQNFGTEAFRREFGEEVWIDNLKHRLRLWLPEKAVITDVRFPNEVRAIQEDMNGKVIRVDASERLDQDDDHGSETALDGFDGFDHVIENNGTVDEYHKKLDEFLPYLVL